MSNSTFKIQIVAFLFLLMQSACSHQHAHEPHDDEPVVESTTHTLYTEKTELFVEFKPLVVGTEIRFATHLTELGQSFKPFTEGEIKLTLDVNGNQVQGISTEPLGSGFFRLRITPTIAGNAKLTFDIKTKKFTDQLIIENVKVYADEKSAIADQAEEHGSGDITYSKEQAWKTEFANTKLKKQPFTEVIKTSGIILSAPGDEMIVTAKAKGIVMLSGSKTNIGSEVKATTNLFIITSGELSEGSIDANYKQAKTNYDQAKADYDRAKDLVKDQIISQRDFLNDKSDFENAQTAFNALAKNHSSKGQTVSARMNGFVKNILVSEGQFVEAGTPLAIISKNKKLILRANVSQKYFDKLPAITSANFKTADNENTFSTSQLNGKLISFGKSAAPNSPFIPITFEIDNIGTLISGSAAEVYLKSFPIPDALVVPISALIEEQGIFFVYVQIEGERFQKREVKLGASDGLQVQLLTGVSEGERVVTKGAYQIKLSTASGTLPAHGHEH